MFVGKILGLSHKKAGFSGEHYIIGGNAIIQSSVNGTSWTTRDTSGQVYGTAFGNNLFLAGRSGVMLWSDDGITWNTGTGSIVAGTLLRALGYGGGVYIAAGSSGRIYSSTDGKAWTSRTAAAGYTGNFYAHAYGASKHVIVGTSPTGNAEIQTSPDGITWTRRTPDAAYAGDFLGLFYADNKFVAVGNPSQIQTSVDGITWVQRTPADTRAYNGVTFGNGRWVVVGALNSLQISSDAETWTSQTISAGGGSTLNDVVYNTVDAQFVAVTAATGKIKVSATALTGTWTTYDPADAFTGAINSVASSAP